MRPARALPASPSPSRTTPRTSSPRRRLDPGKETYLSAAAFPAQPNHLLGNATRYNPKLRGFPTLNENVSLGKAFAFREQLRLDFRAEAFNLLNRTGSRTPTRI